MSRANCARKRPGPLIFLILAHSRPGAAVLGAYREYFLSFRRYSQNRFHLSNGLNFVGVACGGSRPKPKSCELAAHRCSPRSIALTFQNLTFRKFDPNVAQCRRRSPSDKRRGRGRSAMRGQVVIVTGGAQGIGRAIAGRRARKPAPARPRHRRPRRGQRASAPPSRDRRSGRALSLPRRRPRRPRRARRACSTRRSKRSAQVDALANARGADRSRLAGRRRHRVVGSALRGQRARAVLSHAGARRGICASAKRGGGDRQHSLDARARRLARAGRLRLDQGRAGGTDQERRARAPLRPHPRQRHLRRLGRHAGRARNAGAHPRAGRGLARRRRRAPAVRPTHHRRGGRRGSRSICSRPSRSR